MIYNRYGRMDVNCVLFIYLNNNVWYYSGHRVIVILYSYRLVAGLGTTFIYIDLLLF